MALGGFRKLGPHRKREVTSRDTFREVFIGISTFPCCCSRTVVRRKVTSLDISELLHHWRRPTTFINKAHKSISFIFTHYHTERKDFIDRLESRK